MTFAVIFDFDGTILDSETAEFDAHRKVFGECGCELTEDEWCQGVGILKPADFWFRKLCERSSSALDYETFLRRQREYFHQLVRMEPMTGIRELLLTLRASGVPRAVASAAPSNWVGRGLDGLELTPLFETIVTADQVARGKPAPDVYLEAARRLGVDPACCVAIEDSGPGLAAAKAAGMRTVIVPHALSRLHELGGADLRVAHAGELTLDTLQELATSHLASR